MGTAKIMNDSGPPVQKEKVIIAVDIEVAGCDQTRYNHKYNARDDYFFSFTVSLFEILTVDGQAAQRPFFFCRVVTVCSAIFIFMLQPLCIR